MTDDNSIFEYAEDTTPEEEEVVPQIEENVDDLPKYEPPKIHDKTSKNEEGGEK